MLKYKYLFARPELVGVSRLYKKECLFHSKLMWAASPVRVGLNTSDFSRIRALHSQVQTEDKDSSAEILEPVGRSMIAEDNGYDLHLQSSYEAAMESLSSLITSKRRGEKSTIASKYEKLERMKMYIKILDLEEALAGLKIIHVAGTKGKGSTCTFCEAILRECGFKTGLFTSPHLIDVTERFRLDGLDICKEKFLHYFWECWHQLKDNVTQDLPMPPLFQFLTVLAFKIFASEKVDVAIIEVGLGGTKDSTNVINDPIVCGIASLGMDHMETLGDTLSSIASHKAGIFKPRVPAFTVPQLPEAMSVLRERASDLKIPLQIVEPIDRTKLQGNQLGLSGDHQLTNAGLAVELCKTWLRRTENWEKLFGQADYVMEDSLPEEFVRGLASAHLSGRAQTFYDSSWGDLTFYLDGAHSPESMEACAKWFSTAVKGSTDRISTLSSLYTLKLGNAGKALSNGGGYQQESNHRSDKITKQILLFNCMEVRDPQVLLPKLVDTCASSGTRFAKAIFVPSISTYSKVTSASDIPKEIPCKDLTWQFKLQRVWEKMAHGKADNSCKNIEIDIAETSPPQRFIDKGDGSKCNPMEGKFTCSAVVSSLPMTIHWLRNYVNENPSYRIQVLVTGSLHLVGDVLKLLKR